MSVTVGNTVYDQKWIEALIKGSKNLISPEIDFVLQKAYYEVTFNLDSKQPHYKAVMNYINSDMVWFSIRYRVPELYLKMFSLGKRVKSDKFMPMKGWGKKDFNPKNQRVY